MVTEARDLGADQLGSPNDQGPLRDADLHAVDRQGHEVNGQRLGGRLATGGGRVESHAFTSAPKRVERSGGNKSADRVCMPASNSARKYWMAEVIGLVAPSPRAQNERPRMLSHRSRSSSMSPSRPSPSSSRLRIWTFHQVPSRHGVHLPHDSCL